MRCVSWNRVNCCTNVRRISSEKPCHRRMTFKVIRNGTSRYYGILTRMMVVLMTINLSIRSKDMTGTSKCRNGSHTGVKLGGGPTGSQTRHLLKQILYLTIEIRHLFAGIHHSAQFIFEYFSLCMMFCKKCCPSRSFCHLSMLGVDRCCRHQTLFKCHKSQTECLECSKTPGRRSGTPPLLSALRALSSALQASHL